ncbi:hypothetical protein CEUSTIGMA_g9199.t1 [Chlamydomonas eustigma]|uniref:Uncharacterized protein n=1 Tax=Chlamydomonas eustigma TaxID=1157962 RepID=A0A250XFB9_9CHLO|nr:hypothetical protein CEUSTIGMA_g9199.t1 [Chlamydomonas eustigma]|eukprot:GAX81771.1 hypothetical protein CEUSTIGMA_g9199.t1 [Chlamydomonas eustigma]
MIMTSKSHAATKCCNRPSTSRHFVGLCEILRQSRISLKSSTQLDVYSNISCIVPSFSSYRCTSSNRSCVVRATAGNAQTAKLISSTEVPAFIQRDDMMDQLHKWAVIEAGEGGFRNFGMPMTVDPQFKEGVLWGYKVGMYKDGVKLTEIGVLFDNLFAEKYEYLGRGEDGFPVLEGKMEKIEGKNIQIWKLDLNPVTEDLRGTIRGFCTGLVAAINRYYSFGSVFVDDERG